jgi:hypothetical protein
MDRTRRRARCLEHRIHVRSAETPAGRLRNCRCGWNLGPGGAAAVVVVPRHGSGLRIYQALHELGMPAVGGGPRFPGFHSAFHFTAFSAPS